MDKFELTGDDMYAIDIATNVARCLLKHPQIQPRQIIGLGNALYALEQLPLITPGADCEFGIVYRAGTEDFNEMRWIEFRISEGRFQISIGGHVFEKPIGGDTYSEPGWLIEVGGYRCTECELELPYLEDWIIEYLNLGAKISISDESNIEYE